ncbi:MAG: hypothetical protein LBJ13_02485, partial [Puniceicoccales bacterium]|nr:hypothetical protein [Puniceicoccales bacterium]
MARVSNSGDPNRWDLCCQIASQEAAGKTGRLGFKQKMHAFQLFLSGGSTDSLREKCKKAGDIGKGSEMASRSSSRAETMPRDFSAAALSRSQPSLSQAGANSASEPGAESVGVPPPPLGFGHPAV